MAEIVVRTNKGYEFLTLRFDGPGTDVEKAWDLKLETGDNKLTSVLALIARGLSAALREEQRRREQYSVIKMADDLSN